MHFYTGPKPAAGAAITTETLIGSCPLSEPCGTAGSGQLTFSTITKDLAALATATIAWCRVVDSDGNYQIDLDCGIVNSGEAVIFNTLEAIAGGSLEILSASFTEGNV